MKSYKMYIIRHAQAEGAEQGRYIGHTDVPLSEEGRAQLSQMHDDYSYPDVEAVFSSPLKRCTETANALFPGKTPIIIEGLAECNFGEFENKNAEELRNNEDFAEWLAGKKAPPFGESSAEFGKRVCSSFEKIVDGMMKSGVFETAMVTHAGVMSVILSAFGLPEAPVYEWTAPNCCGFALRLDTSLWMRNKKFEVYSRMPEE